ncbi:MAG TPA: large conductance mechanosensitive channel protein MscL [Kofleriaceae bacterium]|nr:large conductance mechanosensitive channel protein MscL [Kofleriaceae bacterium]
MPLLKEFKTFAVKGNVIDLAVAVVIGAAFSKIVTALVSEVVMPLVGKVMPSGDWVSYTLGGIRIGVVFGSILDFMVVSFVLFIVVVKFMGAMRRRLESGEPVEPTSKKCPECLEEIPLAARRCRACASEQPV